MTHRSGGTCELTGHWHLQFDAKPRHLQAPFCSAGCAAFCALSFRLPCDNFTLSKNSILARFHGPRSRLCPPQSRWADERPHIY